MFPTTLKFTATPLRLQQAVDSLPEPKGRTRTGGAQDGLRDKLLQVDVDKLRQWKMKPAMLRKIPALALERQNRALQERVLAISISSLENMDMETIAALIPYVWENTEFRLALNAYFVRKPPQETWLQEYYKVFREANPPVAMAAQISPTISLCELHRQLSMHTSNPWFALVVEALLEQRGCGEVQDWEWNRTLNFLDSGYPLVVRQQVVEWLLQTYCGEQCTVEDVCTGPLGMIAAIGTRLLPKYRWNALSLNVQNTLHVVEQLQAFHRWMPEVETVWRPWFMALESMSIHRPSGWLFLYFKHHVLVLSLVQRGAAIQVLTRQSYRQEVHVKLRQSSPFAIQSITSVLDVSQKGVEVLEGWLQEQGYVQTLLLNQDRSCLSKPERWM